MAYADQKQNRAAAIGSVALVHAALGAALLSGLVVKFAPPDDKIFEATNVPVPKPPEPVPPPPPELHAEVRPIRETPIPPITVPIPEVITPNLVDLTTTTTIFPPQPTVIRIDEPPQPPVTPASVDLSRALKPRGDQGGWFPQDSYPAAARRAGAEGRVSVSVDVGTNGRVTACRVLASSGNDELDAATCRLATRNGRFEPARGTGGEPVASTTSLRNVRWVLDQ